MPRFKDSTINLPEKIGDVRDWSSIKVGLLLDLRDELKQLNAVFACQNFTNLPKTMRGIHAELVKARKAREAK